MEELAYDVGGGGDAEDDGAQDLLPPGQEQHGVFVPAAGGLRPASFDHAHRAVPLLPVALAVGEVVAVVYGRKRGGGQDGFLGPASGSGVSP